MISVTGAGGASVSDDYYNDEIYLYTGMGGISDKEEIVLEFSSSAFLYDEFGYSSDDLIAVTGQSYGYIAKQVTGVIRRNLFLYRYSKCAGPYS